MRVTSGFLQHGLRDEYLFQVHCVPNMNNARVLSVNEVAGAQTSHAEHQKAVGAHIGAPVEKEGIRTDAHGMQAEQHLLQKLFGIKLGLPRVVPVVFPQDQLIQVREDRHLLRRQALEVRIVGDAPLGVEPGQQDLDGVHVGVREVLVGAEEILEPGDVLGQHGAFAEGLGRLQVRRLQQILPRVPALRLQHVDAVLTGHEIDEIPAERRAELPLFMLGVQRNHGLSGFQEIDDQVLHQMGFALARVTQDQDVAGGLVRIALVEVHEDVRSVVILADVKAPAVGFAAVIERIEVGHRRGGQDALKEGAEDVVSAGADAAEALLLTKREPIHIELAPSSWDQARH